VLQRRWRPAGRRERPRSIGQQGDCCGCARRRGSAAEERAASGGAGWECGGDGARGLLQRLCPVRVVRAEPARGGDVGSGQHPALPSSWKASAGRG